MIYSDEATDRSRKSLDPETPIDSVKHVLSVLAAHPRARIIEEPRARAGSRRRQRWVHELVIPGAFATGAFAVLLVEPAIVKEMEAAGLLVATSGRYFLAAGGSAASGTSPGR